MDFFWWLSLAEWDEFDLGDLEDVMALDLACETLLGAHTQKKKFLQLDDAHNPKTLTQLALAIRLLQLLFADTACT